MPARLGFAKVPPAEAGTPNLTSNLRLLENRLDPRAVLRVINPVGIVAVVVGIRTGLPFTRPSSKQSCAGRFLWRERHHGGPKKVR